MTDAQLRASIVALLASIEASTRTALLRTLQHVRSLYTVEQLALMISQGRLFDATATRELREAINYYVVPVLAAGLISGGQLQADYLRAGLGRLVGFDPREYGALRSTNDQAVRLTQRLVSDADTTGTNAVLGSMNFGGGSADHANALVRAMGITVVQLQLLQKYERTLRMTPRVVGQPSMVTQLDNYANRLLAARLTQLALDESQFAMNVGMAEATKQAIRAGFIDESEVIRRWFTMRDPVVRDSHAPMHGQLRRLDEPFTTGHSASLMFPGDPAGSYAETRHCRCGVETVLL